MMSRIKKNKASLLILFFLFLLLGTFVFAQSLEVEYPAVPGTTLPAEPTLPEYVRYIYNFSIIVAGLVAFFSLVYGGFRYLTSVGSPVAMADARSQIFAGILGLVILLASFLILTILNPQLAVFRLAKEPLPVLEMPEIPEIEIAEATYFMQELPVGALIEMLLEEDRLNEIKNIVEETRRLSEEVKNKAGDLVAELANCSCDRTSPDPATCDPGEPCPDIVCVGDPCDRVKVNERKAELEVAIQALENWLKSGELYLSQFKKEAAKLELAAYLLEETIYPLNYDNLLEVKQVILTAGGDVKIVPFSIYGQTVRGGPDSANFYIDLSDLPSGIILPPFNGPSPLAACDECEIPLRDINVVVTGLGGNEAAKDHYAGLYPAGGVKADCDGMDCWDYVIQWAKNNGWNPVFMLALWGEESGFDPDGWCDIVKLDCDVLGVVDCPGGGDLLSQLECFPVIDENCKDPATGEPICRPPGGSENTDFCAFMRCYSGGDSCSLLHNPNFFPDLYKLYTEMVAPDTLGYPEGKCVSDQALPADVTCPLWPGSFDITCGWGCYAGHRGTDFGKCGLGYWGQPVYAVDSGVVNPINGSECGLGVSLITENGTFIYCHFLNWSDIIAPGIEVGKGELLGFTNSTGHVEPPGLLGSHLHFGAIIGGVYYDPETLGIQCIDEADYCF